MRRPYRQAHEVIRFFAYPVYDILLSVFLRHVLIDRRLLISDTYNDCEYWRGCEV